LGDLNHEASQMPPKRALPNSGYRNPVGMPRDTFVASGNLGQRIYIIPSSRLVIVRLAITQWLPDFDMAGDNRSIRTVVAALGSAPEPACTAARYRTTPY
jgi:CubicO group peptidase (beta-lactamase class C family)